LFVVVVFIPIWSLGRKRIIDQCPKCTAHYVLSAREWEAAGQQNLSDALAMFAGNPTPVAAAQAHAQLLGFFQYDEAEEFRNKALAQFPDDGELRSNLAQQMQVLQQHSEAAMLFEDAWNLSPDLPAARAGHAHYLMGAGKLDEAWDLLDFLLEPGAAKQYEMHPLLVLFEQLQLAGRNEDALSLAPHILEELPALQDDFWFRKVLERAEGGAGRPESLLPPRNRSWFSLLFSNSRDYSPKTRTNARIAVGLVVVLGALALHNFWISQRRTVYVLNQTGESAQVSIDGQPALTVAERAELHVAEGEHEVKISGPIDGADRLIVSASYFDRWFRKPVWIINVNGEAIIEESEITYAVAPPPAVQRLRMAETVMTFPHVDYLFDDEPPQSMKVKGHQTVVKTQVQVINATVMGNLPKLCELNSQGGLALAEKVMSRDPDSDLVDAYCAAAKKYNGRDRAASFMEKRLDERPIDIAWHRQYQELRDTPADAAKMLARYEQLTQKEPNSAAAWYLFARRDPDDARSWRSVDKALEVDPQFGWALYMRGSHAFSQRNWDRAEQDISAALAAPEHDDGWHVVFVLCLLAQEKYEAADAECDKLPAFQRMAGFSPLVRMWTQQRRNLPVDRAALLSPEYLQIPPQVVDIVRPNLEMMFAYAAADWDELRNLQRKPQFAELSVQRKSLQLLGALTAQEMQLAFQAPNQVPDEMEALSVALAFELVGNRDAAATWFKHSLQLLQQGNLERRQVAAALTAEKPPSVDQIREISLSPVDERSLVCAVLAWRFPEQRPIWMAEARLWQLLPLKTYWLVEEALHRFGDATP
jgi:tetratricopeptide (TPR) repeat protein